MKNWWGMVPAPLRWWAGALALLAGFASVELWGQRQADAREKRLERLMERFKEQVQLDDSTAAKSAALEARMRHIEEHLSGLANAAKTLGGRPVAGVGIRVPARDTIIVHDTVETVVRADSTRTGTVTDSTFAGQVRVDITAPPFPAPLQATVSVRRPEFRPEVGFVQVGNQVVATVTWQGERVAIESPFFAPAAARRRRFEGWAEATYNLTAPHRISGGVGVNLGKWQLGPSASQSLERGRALEFGVTLRRGL